MGKMLYLRCNGCSRTFSFVGDNPLKDNISCCPSCGSNKIKMSSTQLNYWEELSKEFKVPTDLLKELFSLWNQQEFTSFYDFCKNMIYKTDEVA